MRKKSVQRGGFVQESVCNSGSDAFTPVPARLSKHWRLVDVPSIGIGRKKREFEREPFVEKGLRPVFRP